MADAFLQIFNDQIPLAKSSILKGPLKANWKVEYHTYNTNEEIYPPQT